MPFLGAGGNTNLILDTGSIGVGQNLFQAYAGLQIRVCTENYFSSFSTKTYVVGTRKNRLNETVLLSTRNTCLN